MHIAQEETKYGLDIQEARQAAASYFLEKKYEHVELCGLIHTNLIADTIY